MSKTKYCYFIVAEDNCFALLTARTFWFSKDCLLIRQRLCCLFQKIGESAKKKGLNIILRCWKTSTQKPQKLIRKYRKRIYKLFTTLWMLSFKVLELKFISKPNFNPDNVCQMLYLLCGKKYHFHAFSLRFLRLFSFAFSAWNKNNNFQHLKIIFNQSYVSYLWI